MIWRPKPGQRVTLCYRPSLRPICPHGVYGTVIRASAGPGPINAQVQFDDGRQMIVPRGNLKAEGK